MYAHNPAQNEPEHIHARLNPARPLVAAPAILYARKERNGDVTIYHDRQATEHVCTFGRDLSYKPRRNAMRTTINGQTRALWWID